MSQNLRSWTVPVICALVASAALAPRVRADGTETLGDPTIDVATGAGFVAAGTGTVDQPGLIEFDVPDGETIQQVLLYWSGEFRDADDDTIEVNGVEVTGELIGGPAYFYTFQGDVYVTAYRADITDLDLVTDGANALEITGMDFDAENAGAGVMVIYGDCADDSGYGGYNKYRYRLRRGGDSRSGRYCGYKDASGCADIQLVDGADLAFFSFPEPRKTTVAQTFTFDSSKVTRVADLALFTGSVEAERPNQIIITVGDATTEIIDLLGDSAGPSWDAPTIPVEIPARATSLTVEVVSTPSNDPLGASVVWVAAALAVPEVSKDCKPSSGCMRNCYRDKNWNRYLRSGKGWCRSYRR